MTKSLILDFVILKKLDLNVEDLLFLHSIHNPGLYKDSNEEVDEDKLVEKKYIKKDSNNTVYLRQSALDLLSYLSIDSFKEFKSPKIVKKSSKKIKAEVIERIDEFRAIWAGLKAGSMGDKHACVTKLSRWMETNPEYSFNDILKAAQLYINTEGSNIQYLQRADYFIYKQENNREESSRLSTFIDEAKLNENNDSNWTSTLN